MPIELDALEEGAGFTFLGRGAIEQWRTIRRLALRSSRQDVLECRLTRPHEDALRMAILAWSYAEWARYAGYGYAASPGAAIVRAMLLDGSKAIPESAVIFFDDPVGVPLGKPSPVFVVQADEPVTNLASDEYEPLGIGVMWGDRMVGILPAGSDSTGHVYEQVAAYVNAGRRVSHLDAREMMSAAGFPRMDHILRITDRRRNRQIYVTVSIADDERHLLARDLHPRRIDPLSGPSRIYRRGREEHFYMIEDLAQRVPVPRIDLQPAKKQAEQMGKIVPKAVCVRRGNKGAWHIASHVRGPRTNPTDFVVYCGNDVPIRSSTRRPLNGAGLDGRGLVCHRCSEVRGLKSVSQRRAEGATSILHTASGPDA